MLRRSWTVCAMTALLLGGTAAAQSPGTLLVGGFGTWTHFDSKWGMDTGFGNSIGYGGRVGAFIAPNWNVDAFSRKNGRFSGKSRLNRVRLICCSSTSTCAKSVL